MRTENSSWSLIKMSMPLKVWILNLDDAPDRLQLTIDTLKGASGLIIKRFRSLRVDRSEDRLSKLSSICPDKTLAISQSHRRLAAAVVEEGKDDEDGVLILEDDAVCLCPTSELRQRLRKAMESARANWDLILLNVAGAGCDVPLDERPGRFCGSMAAYLLSPSGAKKLSKAVLSWHADLLRNSDAFDVRRGPQLFATRDQGDVTRRLGRRDFSWFLRQPCVRWKKGGSLPLWIVAPIGVVAVVSLAFSAWLSARRWKYSAPAIALASALPLAFITALAWHSSRDTNYTRCSIETLLLFGTTGLVGAALSLASLFKGSQPALSATCLVTSLVVVALTTYWADEKVLTSKNGRMDREYGQCSGTTSPRA